VTIDDDTDVEAFDAFVLEHTGNDTETAALVEYESDPEPGSLATYEFEEGLNFVPPAAAGSVDDVLFPGSETDFVQTGTFELGDNLYGDNSATQVRDGFTDPAASGFGGNFRAGVGDEKVHPHAGYFVIVNDEDNVGLTIGERIMAGTAPTAEDIEDRTDDDDE